MVRNAVFSWFGIALVTLLCACEKTTQVTAPSLSATCEARPASGPAPLAVSFVLGVAGAEGPIAVSIQYGDGTSGSDPDATHRYATAGTFVASFTITTPKQSARCAAPVTVNAPPPPPAVNLPPAPVYKTVPAASGSSIAGTAPLEVTFNLCASSDPEGDRLYFAMDLDGDGRFESGGATGAACRKTHLYPAGTWQPRLCLHDEAEGRPLHEDLCRVYTVAVAP